MIEFFRSCDWIANVFGIVVVLVTFAIGLWKWLLFKIRIQKIDSVIPSQFESTWSAASGKHIATVAIVDDQPLDFPIDELTLAGFNISSFTQVHLVDIPKLASYDIVFLDIKGIVKDNPEYGGLILIAELRRINPTQKICAVSSRTFDPTATEFFKQADSQKKKPLTAQECKAVIETFIQQVFDVANVISNARAVYASMPPKQKKVVLNDFKHSLLHNEGADVFDSTLSAAKVNTSEMRRVVVLLYRMIHHAC